MTPPAKKRKIADEPKAQDDANVDGKAVPKTRAPQHLDKEVDIEPSGDSQPDTTSVDKNQERKERFKALQARAVSPLCLATSQWLNTGLYVAKICSE